MTEAGYTHTHTHTELSFGNNYLASKEVHIPHAQRAGLNVPPVHTCARAESASVCRRQRVPLALAETPHRGLLIDTVFIDGVYVVLWGLQGPQFGAQVPMLAAV